MIQALFCFSSARRRGQPDGWRWLPRRDKTARLSRHNRSVRLLARPRGHGPGAGWVLLCPFQLPTAVLGLLRVSAAGWGQGQEPGVPADTPGSPCSAAGRYSPVSWLPAMPAALAPRHPKIPREAPARGAPHAGGHSRGNCSPSSTPVPLPSSLQGLFTQFCISFSVISGIPTSRMLTAASPCSTTPWNGCRTPPRTPSLNGVVFENSKASPIRSSGAAERWRGTGAVTVPP